MSQNTTKVKRWSARNKLEVVLRLIAGEPIDDVSREIGVEISKLDEWKREAIDGMEARFKVRNTDPRGSELNRAKQQIGDLLMENELLRERIKKQGPLVLMRSK